MGTESIRRDVVEAATYWMTDPCQELTDLRPVEELFGEDCFDLPKMKERLSPEIYEALIQTVEQGKPMTDEAVAGEIAIAMRQWATEKGATHYTHWFHPLTGTTAEKHDSLFKLDAQLVCSGLWIVRYLLMLGEEEEEGRAKKASCTCWLPRRELAAT